LQQSSLFSESCSHAIEESPRCGFEVALPDALMAPHRNAPERVPDQVRSLVERNLRRAEDAGTGRLCSFHAAASTGSFPARRSSRYGKSS
jgi:hypothetical protein